MDEILLRQLVRQLKILNVWITVFGSLVLIVLIILGVLIFKMVMFVHATEQRLADIQTKTAQTLDVQSKICKSDTLSSLLNKSTDYCK